MGVIHIFNTGLYLSKKTSRISMLTTGAALLNILLNILLVPLWGIMGAAVTTVLSYGALAWVTYHVAQRSYLIPYDLRRLLILCVVSTALYGLSLGLRIRFSNWILVAKSGLWMSYPFILYFIGFYEPLEMESVKRFLGRTLRKIRIGMTGA
jgi:O-antigen/teichoic acid export membrane protein